MPSNSVQERDSRRAKVWKLWLLGHKDPSSIAARLGSSVKTIERDLEFLKRTEIDRLKNSEGPDLAYVEAVRRKEQEYQRLQHWLEVIETEAMQSITLSTGETVERMSPAWIEVMLKVQKQITQLMEELDDLRGLKRPDRLEISSENKHSIEGAGPIMITGLGGAEIAVTLDRLKEIVGDIPVSRRRQLPPAVIFPDGGVSDTGLVADKKKKEIIIDAEVEDVEAKEKTSGSRRESME